MLNRSSKDINNIIELRNKDFLIYNERIRKLQKRQEWLEAKNKYLLNIIDNLQNTSTIYKSELNQIKSNITYRVLDWLGLI